MAGCLIPHTPIAVDYWRKRDIRSKVCFLSHMHTDHTQGLTSSWDQVIFCSEITRSLAIEQLKIQPSLLVAIPVGQSTIIPLDNAGTENMTVTLIDANHCAGAVMFLFQGYFGCILHTGDFRYFDGMLDIPLFTNGIVINTLYLDNTYCDPKCEFPTRAEAKEKILEIIHNNPEKDIRFGVDMLGKEDMLCDIAKDQGFPIFVDEFRYKTAELLGYGEYFTLNQEETYIRAEKKSCVNRCSLAFLNNGICPTIGIIPSALYQGRDNPFVKSDTIFVVPYSDHSSFSELKKFVAKLKPQRIIPIVSKKNKDEDSHDRADMTIFAEEMSSDAGQHVFDVPSTVQAFISRDFSGNLNCGGKKRKASTSYFNGRSKRACGIVFSPGKQVGVLVDEDQMPIDPNITNRSETDVKENEKGTEVTFRDRSAVVNANIHSERGDKTGQEETASPTEEASIKVIVKQETEETSKENRGKSSQERAAPPNQDKTNTKGDIQGDQAQETASATEEARIKVRVKEETEETSKENRGKNSQERAAPPNQDKTNAKGDIQGDQAQETASATEEARIKVRVKEETEETSKENRGKNSQERAAPPNQDKTNAKGDNQGDQAPQSFEESPEVMADTTLTGAVQSSSGEIAKQNHGKNSHERTAPPSQDKTNVKDDNQGDQTQQSFVKSLVMADTTLPGAAQCSCVMADKTLTGAVQSSSGETAKQNHGKNSHERTAPPSQDKTNIKDDNQGDQTQQYFVKSLVMADTTLPGAAQCSSGETAKESRGESSQERAAPSNQDKTNAKDDNQGDQTQQSSEKSPLMADTTLPGAAQSSSGETAKQSRGKNSQERAAPSNQDKTNAKDDNQGDQTQQSSEKSLVMADTTLPGAAQSSSGETAKENRGESSQERTAPSNQDKTNAKDDNQGDQTQQSSEKSPVLPDAAQSSSEETSKENRGDSSQERAAPPTEQAGTDVKEDIQDDQTHTSIDKFIAAVETTLPGASQSISEEKPTKDRNESSRETAALAAEQTRTTVNDDNQDDQTHKCIDKSAVVLEATLPGTVQSSSDKKSNQDLKGFGERALDTILSSFWPRKSNPTEDNEDESLPNLKTTDECVRQEQTQPDGFQSELQLEREREEAIPRATDDQRIVESCPTVSTESIQIQKTPNSAALTDSASNGNQNTSDEKILGPIVLLHGSEKLQSSKQKGIPVLTVMQGNKESPNCASTVTRIKEIPPTTKIAKAKIQEDNHGIEIRMPSHKSVAVVDPVGITALPEAQGTSSANPKEVTRTVGQEACAQISDDERAKEDVGDCEKTALTKRQEEQDKKIVENKEGKNSSRNDMPKPVAIRANDEGILHGSTEGLLSVSLEPTDKQKSPNLVPQTESASSKDVETSCIEKDLETVKLSQNNDDNIRLSKTEKLPIPKQLSTSNGPLTSSHLELNTHEPLPILTELPENYGFPTLGQSDLQLKRHEQSAMPSELLESQGSSEIVSSQSESCISSRKMSIEMHEEEGTEERVLPSKRVLDETSRQNSDPQKADPVSSNLSSPTGNNKYPKILDNVERPATAAQANGKQSSLNTISSAQEIDEPQNHKSTRNQDDLKVLNDTESSITVSEANDEESQVESVEKEEYLKALNDPGTSINISGTDREQSTPNRDSSAQEVSESQPNDSDENEVCLNIMNDTGTYVRIEVDDAVQVTINNVHSPQELSESQICEPVRKEEYAKVSNNEETLSTVAEGDGERYNFNKLTNKLEDSSRQELDKPNTPQSQEVTLQSLEGYREEECPNERTSIQEKVDEPIKGTPSKVPTKSISRESQTHIEKLTRNNITFTQKLSEYKLYECDLNIELEDDQRLTKRVKKRYESTNEGDLLLNLEKCAKTTKDKRPTGARKIRYNRALNTVEISTVEKVGFPTFQCSGQTAYPKRMKRTEMASDENADNAEASDEIQEPRAKRKKTQVSTEQEPSGSQVCECDCQEESTKQVIRVETPSNEDVGELLVVHNEISGIKKPSPMFQCTGQVAYPKRMKRTEIDIDGNSDNLETVDNETQQPHAKRRKTQSESQMSDCDLQEEHPNHVNTAKTHISEKEDITQNKVSTTKEASESQVSEFEETYRKVFVSLCNQVASAQKRSSILGCNRQVEHQKSALLMETPENADDPQVIQNKVPTSQTPSVSACASEHRDDVSALKTKRRKSSGFYTGDVSFARTVLERWIREHVSDGEDEN